MKRRLIQLALASCLCASASPVPWSFTRDSVAQQPTPIAPDLSFNATAIDDSLAADEPSDVIATGIDLPDGIIDNGFTIDDTQGSGSLRAPEPPPITMAAIGVTFLAAFAILRRLRTEKRRARRRTLVRIRALTAIQ